MKIGDKLKMDGERTRYTIQGFDDCFVIVTKRHFDTYLYCIIDRKKHIRGALNAIFGLPFDVDSPNGAMTLLEMMHNEECWGVSYRNQKDLTDNEIAQIKRGEA